MEPQVADFVLHLKPGGTYLFDHVRKGPFVAIFREIVYTPEDEADPYQLRVDIITEDGSGQERLSTGAYYRSPQGAKLRPFLSERLIRPNLLRTITSPNIQARDALALRFKNLRDEAENIASEYGLTEAPLPYPSVPTASALAHLEDEDPAPLPWWKRILGME